MGKAQRQYVVLIDESTGDAVGMLCYKLVYITAEDFSSVSALARPQLDCQKPCARPECLTEDAEQVSKVTPQPALALLDHS